MAIPNYDALQVDLSERLEDAVAAATTDGKKWTSAQRDAFMNEGIRRWLGKWVVKFHQRDPRAEDALQNHIVEYSGSMTGGKISLTLAGLTTPNNGGVLHIIDVYNTTDSAYVKRAPARLKTFLEKSVNSFLTENYWSNDAGSIEVFGTGVGGTETINIRFIKGHVVHVANTGSDDILVPKDWWPEVLDMATIIGLESDPTSEHLTQAQVLGNRNA